ncbi:signal transduction histidine kinase [Nitratidesulfovibrio vulgaris DP4]|uniref:histidine kinase n=2 Tax=Nitratidesulfovibrio vulgaris TaxID=881 RepID=A0A0H3ABN4_NITV4|nr:signal transduction histidine kinase [Nitratidesulfovibrio vulgaris DP4]
MRGVAMARGGGVRSGARRESVSGVRMYRILIADDEPVVRYTLALYLEDAGYRVLQAGTVREALDLFDAEGADIAFIDWHMPGGGGAEALPLFASRAPTLPVVVVSGTNNVSDVIRALQLGAWDFMTKPIVDLAMVEQTLERCLVRARLLRDEGRLREHLEEQVLQRSRELEEANAQLRREIAERRDFEAALGESEARFRQLVENIHELFWVRDVFTWRLLYISPACETLFGVSPKQVIEKPELLHHFLAQSNREKFVEELLQTVRAGEVFDAEVQAWGAHGDDMVLRVRAFPVRDAAGHIYRVAGVAEDVTQRRQAERRILTSLREKEILLKEVHHRVKNNLQLVVSLLNLQASSVYDVRDRALLLDSRNRIASMALVHEELYRSDDLSGVDFADYLPRLARKLQSAFVIDVELDLQLDVAPVMLPVDIAIPCGLILNELIANALKHAFAERGHGRLSVSLQCQGGRAVLAVADDGVGLPAPFEALGERTLGVQLVRSLVQQLGGELRQQPGPGAHIVISFPVGEV